MSNIGKKIVIALIAFIAGSYTILPIDAVPMCPIDDVIVIIVGLVGILKINTKRLPE